MDGGRGLSELNQIIEELFLKKSARKARIIKYNHANCKHDIAIETHIYVHRLFYVYITMS